MRGTDWELDQADDGKVFPAEATFADEKGEKKNQVEPYCVLNIKKSSRTFYNLF